MKVYFVGAGPGNPELLTMKAVRLLATCSICIYAGSLVSPEVMAVVHPDAKRYDSAKMSLEDILAVCREGREKNLDIIRLHSGDPSIYGAIREQMNGLDAMGIGYEVVPGVSAFQAAAAALKVELTAPEVSQTIILTRTSGRTPLPEEQELEKLAGAKATLCIFLSGHKVEEVVATLIPYYGEDCPAAVVYHASWPDEKILEGVLGDIVPKVKHAQIGQTSLIIVGQTLGRSIPPSKLYDARFSHQFRTGAEKT
ncbi:MAG: Cobalt-precorrin-4 C(11)-methyltransferase [Syntrophus sp. SKADARSKE-3]|nr:Cobalt-precorrin-4 C(11)-methyltransferase [Syntrophus sp. SKADARSKE-3]